MKKNKEKNNSNYGRTAIFISREIHGKVKEYCQKAHPGIKLYACAERLLIDALTGKGFFLP